MEERSKLLFGQNHRLAVMIAIAHAPRGRVNPTELAKDLGLAQSAFQKPLSDLLDAGLVTRELEFRRNVYVKQPSKVWDWILELEQQVRADEQAQQKLRRLRSS